MGFFKNIGKAIGGAAKGIVKTVSGAGKNIIQGDLKGLVNDGVGGLSDVITGVFGGSASSGMGSTSGDAGAYAAGLNMVVYEILGKLIQEFKAKEGRSPSNAETLVLKSKALEIAKTSQSKPLIDKVVAQISGGSNVNGTTVKSTIGNALDSIFNSVIKSVGNGLGGFVETAIGKGSEAAFGSKPAKTLQQTLSGWLGGVVDGTLKDWLKRNWIFVILPFGFILYAVYRLLFNSSGSRKGGKSKGIRTK